MPLLERARAEMTAYRQSSGETMAKSPLDFCKETNNEYPFVVFLAKLYICVSASSVANERIFFTAGNTVTVPRACLGAEHIHQLIFLKKNIAKEILLT